MFCPTNLVEFQNAQSLLVMLCVLVMIVSVFIMGIILEILQQFFITKYSRTKGFILMVVTGIWLCIATTNLCYTLYMNLS